MNEPSATTLSFNSGGWSGSLEYRKDTSQTTSSSVFYELYVIGGNAANSTHGLEFRKESDGSTKVYAETAGNTHAPFTLSVVGSSGSSVEISSSTTALGGWNLNSQVFEITVTSSMLWTASSGSGSGSGTGVEGSSYSGTLTVNGNDLEYEIPSSSSSGSYYLLSGVNNTFSSELTIAVGSNGATGSAPNFDQTKTWILRSPTEYELARWSPPSTNKKVFCNFW